MNVLTGSPWPAAVTLVPAQGVPRAGRPLLRDVALAAAAAQAFAGLEQRVTSQRVASRPGEAAGTTTGAAESRFLLDRLVAVEGAGRTWVDALDDCLKQPAAADARLCRLAAELGLGRAEILAVALAAAVEEDALLGRALALLQAPVAGSRPTLGLLASCLAPAFAGEEPQGAGVLAALVGGRAAACGLLILLAEGSPLPERPVAVPLPLALALQGREAGFPGAVVVQEEADLELPPSLVTVVRRHAAALAAAPGRGLVIRTASDAEARAVAAAVAAESGRRAVLLDRQAWQRESGATPGALAPWLLLSRLLPVFRVDPGPGERQVLAELPGYDGPVLALAGPEGGVEMPGRVFLDWTVPVPPRKEREQLWRQALRGEWNFEADEDSADQRADLAAQLARAHRHGCGRIAHLGRLAHHHGALAGRRLPERDDVTAAAWSLEGGGLEALAQALPDPVGDDALVLPPALRVELEALLRRCRCRDGLVDELGAPARARYRPGVRALLTGASGTGKTLATSWLAGRLGLPLYRVDLASVTSKYIGETEKNLARLLARAEGAEVVLLFDEADSLFGKRTEVKDSNDRFANAQTNYLLQRIETFDGIAILTSNSRARFDSAFTRRLDAIIDFPLPGPEERRRLWLAHLGEGHALTPAQVNQLSAVVALGGGHVRNAVLAAAVDARDEDRAITFADLCQGLAAEYRKLGKQLPAGLKV